MITKRAARQRGGGGGGVTKATICDYKTGHKTEQGGGGGGLPRQLYVITKQAARPVGSPR